MTKDLSTDLSTFDYKPFGEKLRVTTELSRCIYTEALWTALQIDVAIINIGNFWINIFDRGHTQRTNPKTFSVIIHGKFKIKK